LTRLIVVTIIQVMREGGAYELVYSAEIARHLRAIEPKYYSLIRENIEEQLRLEPDTETRNRKPLRLPAAFEAEWEIRFGPNTRFRVMYEIDYKEREVRVLAIGVKQGNRLLIAGKVVSP
jgi:mRNA-degrading endonuclease RelE of RelBE toxin-antitoxin system